MHSATTGINVFEKLEAQVATSSLLSGVILEPDNAETCFPRTPWTAVITSFAFDTTDDHGQRRFPLSRHTGFLCPETSVSYVLNQNTAVANR